MHPETDLEELVALCLRQSPSVDPDGPAPRERTVPGLCDVLGVDRTSMAERIEVLAALSALRDDGLADERVRGVAGDDEERSVYVLTAAGRDYADRRREAIAADPPTVTVHEADGDTVVRAVSELDPYFEDAPLIRGLARATERGVLSLEEAVGTAFVDRTAERERLREFQAEDGTVAGILEGPIGVGKTALIEAVRPELEVDGVEVILGRCQPDTTEPYEPFVDALGSLPGDDAVEEGLDASNVEASEFEQRRKALYTRVQRLLRDRAATRPLLLVLEDLHWADRATVKLFAALTERLGADDGVTLLATTRGATAADGDSPALEAVLDRPGDRPDAGQAPVAWLVLGPFEESVVRDLIVSLLGTRDVPDHVVDLVYEATNGSPLLVEETVEHLRESGRIDPAVGVYPPADADLDLSTDARTTVERRLAALEDVAEHVLAVGAVLGNPVPIEVLAELADPPAATVREYVDGLVAGRFLERLDAATVAIPSRLLRDAAAERLPAERRTELHRRAARERERAGEGQLAAVARHLEAAGDADEAIEAWLEAGDDALFLYATGVAVERYGRALTVARGVDRHDAITECLLRIGETHAMRGDFDRANKHLTYVRETAEDPERRLWAVEAQAGNMIERGEYEAGVALVEDALEDGGEGPRRTIAAVKKNAGRARLKQGDLEGAEVIFEEVLSLAEEAGDEILHGRALSDLGTLHIYRNEYDAAIDRLEAAKDVLGSRNRRHLDYVLNNLAAVYWRQGNPARARSLLERALSICEDLGLRTGAVAKLVNLGVVVLDVGDWDEGEVYLERALERAEEYEMRPDHGLAATYLGLVALHRGRPGEALDLLAGALETFADTGSATDEYYARFVRAEARFVRDDVDGAAVDALALLEDAAGMDEPSRAAPGAEWLGRLALDRGDVEAAVDHLELAVERADDGDARHAIDARCGLARAHLAADRHGAAAETVRAATERAEEAAIELRMLRTARVRGRCLIAAGRYDGAEQVLRGALDRANEIGSALERVRVRLAQARLASERPGVDPDDAIAVARELASGAGFERLERVAGALADRTDETH